MVSPEQGQVTARLGTRAPSDFRPSPRGGPWMLGRTMSAVVGAMPSTSRPGCRARTVRKPLENKAAVAARAEAQAVLSLFLGPRITGKFYQ